MNNLISTQKLKIDNVSFLLSNIKTYEVPCNCIHHNGGCVKILEATLPNGKWVAIQKDYYGYHVLVLPNAPKGSWWNRYDCPTPISESKLIQRILKEL